MNTDNLINLVKQWGRNKGLNDPVMQFAKMIEESGEFAHELTRNKLNSAEIKDAIGDIEIALIILADIIGYDIRECLEVAYEEIKNRKGKTVNGSFVKNC